MFACSHCRPVKKWVHYWARRMDLLATNEGMWVPVPSSTYLWQIVHRGHLTVRVQQIKAHLIVDLHVANVHLCTNGVTRQARWEGAGSAMHSQTPTLASDHTMLKPKPRAGGAPPRGRWQTGTT